MPVKRKSEMTPEELGKASDYQKKGPPMSIRWDSNHLRWPTAWLQQIGLAVIFFSLEDMSLYCDAITDDLLTKNDAVTLDNLLLQVNERQILYRKLNATAVGNLAAIACRASNNGHREKALLVLNKIYAYQRETIHSKFN